MDSEGEEESTKAVNRFSWDVYHIENYLLDDTTISETINSMKIRDQYDPGRVAERLNIAARNVVQAAVVRELRSFVNGKMVASINLKINPKSATPSGDFRTAVERSYSSLGTVLTDELTGQKLAEKEEKVRQEIESSFADGSWRAKLPGREILHQFVDLEGLGVGYEVFRNLLVSRMVERGVKPRGMQVIFDKVRNG